MALTDAQRNWLDRAIKKKGRFTTKGAVKRQLDDYIRRREKTDSNFAMLPSDHPQYQTIQDGLRAADKFAGEGDLKSAYRTLDNIKAISRGAAAGRAAEIQIFAMRRDMETITDNANLSVKEKNAAIENVDNLIANVGKAPKASDLATFEEALEFCMDFVAEETRFRGLFQDSIDQCFRVSQSISARMIGSQVEMLLKDISALKLAGRGKEVASLEVRCVQIADLFKNNKFFFTPAIIAAYPVSVAFDNREKFEAAITACKSLEKWQARDIDNRAPDAETDAARQELKEMVAAREKLIEDEKGRLKEAIKEIMQDAANDRLVLVNTSKGEISLTPEPAKFDPGTTLDGIAGEALLGGDISDEQADAIAAQTGIRIAAFLKDVTTDKDKLFDLSVKKRSELRDMIALETLGTTDPSGWTDSQKTMLDKAVAAAQKAICQNLPNQLAADGSTISVGGKEYKNPVVLKQGGNGKATLYTDDDGNPIVLKTLLLDEEWHQEVMIREMQIHHRAMNGADEDSAIVGFHGAIRSENGQMHMVLEAADGGDLADRNNALSAASSAGLIPDRARQALALNDLIKTVKAMKQLERQGLVHHDLKGENIMMTKEGKIKIIDFGESDFLDETGQVHVSRGSTPGYVPKEIINEKSHDSKSDTYALSGMIQRLVADITPSEVNKEANMKSVGVLARLVNAISDPDPEKRPSLDAILQSSLAKSYENDFTPGSLKDLQEASVDFTMQLCSVKGEIDVDDLKTKLSRRAGSYLETPIKLKDLQNDIISLEGAISELIKRMENDKALSLNGGRDQLAELRSDVAVLKGQVIRPIIEQAVSAGEARYKAAINPGPGDPPMVEVEIVIADRARKITLANAVETRDALNRRMIENQAKALERLNDAAENPNLQEMVDEIDQITETVDLIKAIDKVIYDAVGREAKLFLAKVKMDKAAAAFGPSGSPAFEEMEDA